MKEKIIKHLKQSKISILIAVSWLTDKDIIEAISQKAEKGITIKILLSASDWNLVRYNEFNNLKKNGVVINKRGAKEPGKGGFMHCKFAVIDEKIVIQGSYNWTKLGNTNDENIDITDDYKKARDYVIEFHKMVKESDDFFENLNDTEIKSIINKYENMENNGLDPSFEINKDNNIQKVENHIIPVKNNLPIIKSLDDFISNHDSFDFKGKLYIKSYRYGEYLKELGGYVSWLNVTSDLVRMYGDYIKYHKVYIKNSVLKKLLIEEYEEFNLLNKRLGGIPDFILDMLLQNREVNINSGVKLFNGTDYLITTSTKNQLTFTLEDIKGSNIFINQGEAYLNDINKGKKTKSDLEKEFAIIHWL